MSVPIIILFAILTILAVLALILVLGALRLKPTPVTDPLPPSQARGDEAAIGRFQELLRLPTVWGAELSHPNHKPFDEVIPLLQRLYPLLFKQLELTLINNYGIVLRWKGSDPKLKPIVLMAHHDVVGANPDEWTHPPFEAVVADGRIWARGAVDTKCILSALLEATEALLAEGYQPPRDVYICSSNNEEDMGETFPQMVEFFKGRDIEPLLVLDEGGAIIDEAPLGVSRPLAMVGVAEKGVCSSKLTISSLGGHASTPSPKDATNKLVVGLSKMLSNPSPAKISPPVAAMLRELAAHSGFGLRLLFGNLWLFGPLVLSLMKGDPETAAMVRTTYALTRLEGSKAHNVIPKSASAVLSIRIDLAESVKIALDRLRSHFNGEVELEPLSTSEPSPVSPYDDEVFAYLHRVIHSVYPQAGIAPYVMNGASDARHIARICPHTYRFGGFMLRAEQRSSVHARDESLDVENYLQGIGFYIEFIRHLDMLR
jgi:carboxypeptidase PM20D1